MTRRNTERSYFFLASLCILCYGFLLFVGVESLLLNIHMPLSTIRNGYRNHTLDDSCLSNQALTCNLALLQKSNIHGMTTEHIDFFSKHTPHITLYLVEFDVQDENGTIVESKLQEIFHAIQDALYGFQQEQTTAEPCRVDWPPVPTIQGGYAMYFFPKDSYSYLQQLSNVVVNATMQYIHRPPTIPDWIHSLPEPERQRAFHRIETYGSPNVFDGFQPHITVGYDVIVPKRFRLDTLDNLYTPQPCFANLSKIAVATTDVAGSVLQNGTLFRISILGNETNVTATTL